MQTTHFMNDNQFNTKEFHQWQIQFHQWLIQIFIYSFFKFSFIHSSELQQWLIHFNTLRTSPAFDTGATSAPCTASGAGNGPIVLVARQERGHDPVIHRRACMPSQPEIFVSLTTTGITLIPSFIIDQASLTALPLRHDTTHSSTYLPALWAGKNLERFSFSFIFSVIIVFFFLVRVFFPI